MTAGNDGERSTFALDVYWASGRRGDPALEEHITGCARCRAYLAGLEALAESRAPAAIAVRDGTERRRRRWALPSALGVGFALARNLIITQTNSAATNSDTAVMM